MKPPLLLLDTEEELSIYSTPGRLTAHVEAPDVVDGEFRLFDVTGVQYPLMAKDDDSPVEIGPALKQPADFELVRRVAESFLERIPPKRRLHSATIDLQTPDGVALALAPYADQ